MKTCPVCHARAFDDAEVCFGCLHRFAAAEPNTSCAAMPKSGSIRGASPAAAGGASAAEGAASAMAAAETAPSTSAAAAASSAIPASPAFARASGSASGRTGLSAMPPAARALGLASPASPQPSMTGDALPVFPANAVSPDRLAVCSGDAVGVARDVSEGAFARVDSAKGSETAVSRVSMMSPEMSASALEGASAKAIFPADVPGGGSCSCGFFDVGFWRGAPSELVGSVFGARSCGSRGPFDFGFALGPPVGLSGIVCPRGGWCERAVRSHPRPHGAASGRGRLAIRALPVRQGGRGFPGRCGSARAAGFRGVRRRASAADERLYRRCGVGRALRVSRGGDHRRRVGRQR